VFVSVSLPYASKCHFLIEGWEYQPNKYKQNQDLHTPHTFTYVKMIPKIYNYNDFILLNCYTAQCKSVKNGT